MTLNSRLRTAKEVFKSLVANPASSTQEQMENHPLIQR